MIELSNSLDRRYLNWYILQVMYKKEYITKSIIEKYVEEPVEIIIFSKEIQRIKNGSKKQIIHPLFPGYLFIKQNVQMAINTVKKRANNHFIKPICFKNIKCQTCFTDLSPCMILPEEMKLLLNTSDNSKIFRISYCFKEGDDIIITKGPLKDLRGNIISINESKKSVYVELSLLKRKIKVTLGIKIIRKDESVSETST